MNADSLPDREFRYRPSWGAMLMGIAFFGACGAFMSWKARTNQDGLNISGIITLDPAGASVFYWIIAILSFAFVALAIGMIALFIRGGQRVVLSREGLIVPRHYWSRREKVIPYAQVADISVFAMGKEEFLRIKWADGKFDFNVSMFESRAAVDELIAQLRERCGF